MWESNPRPQLHENCNPTHYVVLPVPCQFFPAISQSSWSENETCRGLFGPTDPSARQHSPPRRTPYLWIAAGTIKNGRNLFLGVIDTIMNVVVVVADNDDCDRGGGGENTTWFLKLSFYRRFGPGPPSSARRRQNPLDDTGREESELGVGSRWS